MNNITMKMNADELILQALREDITSEDITTNSVMPCYQAGVVDLICKQDGVIAGLEVFKRVFELLDEKTEVEFYCKDGDAVKKGEKIGLVRGDIRVLLSGKVSISGVILICSVPSGVWRFSNTARPGASKL